VNFLDLHLKSLVRCNDVYVLHVLYFNVVLCIGGLGSGDMASQMAAMQQQLLQNPEMMRQMMESPLMQGMMNNPEMLRNVFTSNPQMQQLLEVCSVVHI